MLQYKSFLPNPKVSAEVIFNLTWPTFQTSHSISLNLLHFLKSQFLCQLSLNSHEYRIISTYQLHHSIGMMMKNTIKRFASFISFCSTRRLLLISFHVGHRNNNRIKPIEMKLKNFSIHLHQKAKANHLTLPSPHFWPIGGGGPW